MASITPSTQVRIPVGDLVFLLPSPTHFCSHYTIWRKNQRDRQRKGAAGVREVGGGKIIQRWRKNYAAAEYLSRAGAGGPKIRQISQC